MVIRAGFAHSLAATYRNPKPMIVMFAEPAEMASAAGYAYGSAADHISWHSFCSST